jgi:hypothetical protein
VHHTSRGDTDAVFGTKYAADAVLSEADSALQDDVVLPVEGVPVRRDDKCFFARRMHACPERVLKDEQRNALSDRPRVVPKRIAHLQRVELRAGNGVRAPSVSVSCKYTKLRITPSGNISAKSEFNQTDTVYLQK